MTLLLDNEVIEEARRFNRKLAWAPRFRVRNRWAPRLGQALLRLSQCVPAGHLARTGIRVEHAIAAMDGLRVPLRVLHPSGAIRGVVLDIHGGGWVIGNARMNDRLNAALTAACGVAVVSVDYRLALDTPVQGVMDDCLAAARWLLQDGLSGAQGLPVFVVGESAGGHLAAATLLRLKAWPDLLRKVEGAVLYYGVYDLAGTPSVQQAGPDTLVLDGPGMVAGLRMLAPGMTDMERRRPPLSPLYGNLDGLPPTLMFVGELDPLKDDTVGMAERWRAGAEVELHLLPQAPHGLIHFPTRMAELVTARSHAWIGERLQLAARIPAG
jgi:acetyl esterase/lipase